MPKRIANSALNASTVNILNVIRQNASAAYQAEVPVITKATDIPKVGEVIYGTPAFSNEFLNALVNRIAIVRVKSANFHNPYAPLKKGYLEYGESIEDIFVNIANVVDYSAEKAEAREFKRTIPDVRSLFHVMNWRVMYPVTIQDNDLRMAFLSADGVTGLIEKIVESVYTAAEYDEFLLFKYLLIKTISAGKPYIKMMAKTSTMSDYAAAFRAFSNKLLFMSKNYNEAGVKTNTPRDRQMVFMDADFNAKFDVDVLSAAFNMDKADFMGRLFLIDSFSEFDNERFATIRENSDGLEEVTAEELEAMKGVKAVILDEEFFQVYDNNNKFTEKYVASGLYWNYFYHTWKTVSYSPFANAVVFDELNGSAAPNVTKVSVTVTGKDVRDEGVALTFDAYADSTEEGSQSIKFVQTEALTKAGISITPDGAMLIPASQVKTAITLNAAYNDRVFNTASKTFTGELVKVGDSVDLTIVTS